MINIIDVRANAGDSAFLIDDGKTTILYDSGFAFTGEAVCRNIAAHLKDRKLDYIFLTHSHYDHALGSVYALKHYPEARVVAGEYCAKIFEKPTARAVMRDLDRKFAKTCGVSEYEDLIDGLTVHVTVSDKDTVRAGDMEFRAVSLPGHTKCSFAFYLESEKLLLSCETLGVYDGEENIIPSYLVGYDMTLRSIEKAQSLDIERMLIPHLGLIEGEKCRFYLENAKKSAAETCGEILSVLKDGSFDDAMQYFKDKFYHGKVVDAYPIDAMELNTSIMINLITKEFSE